MNKSELVTQLSRKLKVESSVAETAVNDTIAELAAPYIFKKPGEEVGLILDNSCSNNCKEPAISTQVTKPALSTATRTAVKA